MTRKDWDHPFLFLFFVAIGVLSIMSLGGYITSRLGWTGGTGFFKQGVMPIHPHASNQMG